MTFTLPQRALATALFAALAQAQPTEKLAVNAVFRDWGPATIAGSAILAGSPTGRDRWPSVELKRELHGLVDADSVVIGVTSVALIAIDKSTGKTAWELPGTYSESSPATAISGNLLYFGGNPRGTLHALELTTRKIVRSYTRPGADANWSCGHVTPFEGGLWVDTSRALLKLQ